MLTRRGFIRLSALGALGAAAPFAFETNPASTLVATATATPTLPPPATKSMLGLFALMNPNDDQIPSEVLGSPLIDGITLQVNWSTLQPAPLVVAWDIVEGALKRAAAAGKKLALRPLTGVGSPSWLYAKATGVTKYTFTPDSDRYHPLDFGKPVTMPYPWDKIMIDQWTKFVQALGARFDGEPAFARISMAGPTFQQAETYLPHSPAVITDWAKAGYSLTNIQVAWEKCLDAYAAGFRQTPFTLDLDPLPDPIDKNGLTFNSQLPTAIGQYGVKRYPGRFFPAQSDFSDVYPFLPAPLPSSTKQPALYESYEKQQAPIYNFLEGVNKSWHFGLTVSEQRVSHFDNAVSAVIERALALKAGYLEIPVAWAADPANAEALKEWSVAPAPTPAATLSATVAATQAPTKPAGPATPLTVG